MGEVARFDFVRDVFRAELAAINARRAEVRRRTPPDAEGLGAVFPPELAVGAASVPSVEHGLVGLALSGGGIRSAAFSLGVLQALHAGGLLHHVDYLSTVSGGGWTGSCLSALMRQPGSSFPFVAPFHVRMAGENCAADAAALAEAGTRNPALEYLRDRASALVPSGFAGGIGTLSRVLRGALITAAMLLATFIVPALILARAVRAYHDALPFTALQRATDDLPWSSFVVLTPRIAAWGTVVLLLLPVLRTVLPGPRRLAQADRLLIANAALGSCTLAFETHAFVTWRVSHHLGSALDLSEFPGRLARWLLPALTPGPTTLAALMAAVAGLVALRARLGRARSALRVAALGLVAAASLAPLYLFVLYVSVVESGADGAGPIVGMRSGALVVAAFGVLFIALMDTNEASLHSLFRAQLARLFIVRRRGATELTPDESVPLSALSQPGSMAPYHLLNAALNLQGSRDPSLRGRNSDFFVFSRHFVGGPRTGYCRTEDLERIEPDVDLSAAMAISAAAAAPNMGTYTLRSVVLLMAFLNLRLGYWLLNPAVVRRSAEPPTLWERFTAFPAGWCYFRELASALHERGPHVYLSDGGHLENTGAYELLRRRCRCLIVSDAEEDPAMRFGGLVALIRFARLDLGVEIEISLDELAPDERGVCRQHSALGRICYPSRDGMPAEYGTLVYIKSSLTGDEHAVVGQYRAENPLFPHESTANQAFGEAQFEAYRALGEHVTRGLSNNAFVGHSVGPGEPGPVATWLRALEARVAPPPHYERVFPALRDELEEVDALLRAPEVAGYFAELYPELAPGPRPAPPAPAVLHEVAMRQIHLIASVHAQLRLDEAGAEHHPWHRGWIQTFRRWMASPSFRRVWIVGSQSYGPRLRAFCERNFHRFITVTWTESSEADLRDRGLSTLAEPDAPGTLVVYLRCDVCCDWDAVVEAVSGARMAFRLDGELATRCSDRRTERPGFSDLASAPESESAMQRALGDLGLPATTAPAALTGAALARLRPAPRDEPAG